MIHSRLAGRRTRRPGGRLGLCPALLLILAAAGCSSLAPARPPALPDMVEPAWLRAGLLDVRFTVTRHDEPTASQTSLIHTVFAVTSGGGVRTMRTAVSVDGVVTSHTTWNGGTTVDSAQLPGCGSVVTQVPVPASLAGWLAEAFGPVDSATGAGWSISGSTASRPGSTPDTVEQAQLTRLPERVTREVTSRTGTVVRELTNIEIHHVDTADPATDLPPCGGRSRPREG